MNFLEEVEDIVNSIKSVADVRNLLNSLYAGEVSNHLLRVIRSTVQGVLSTHPEFFTSGSIDRVSKVLSRYLEYVVEVQPSGSVRTVVDFDEGIYSYINLSIPKWNEVISVLREELEVDYSQPIRNSNFFRYLSQVLGMQGELTDQRLEFVPENEAWFLPVIIYGNVHFPFTVVYGGERAFSYSGIDLLGEIKTRLSLAISKFESELKSKLSNLVIVENRTRAVERLMGALEEEMYREVEFGILEMFEGKRSKVYIKAETGKWYELFITRTGRVGARYSLALNRRRFE